MNVSLHAATEQVRERISRETLIAFLNYDPSTGVFTRREAWRNSRIPVGGEAGATPNSVGYRQIMLCGRQYLCHRLAWLFHCGEWPPSQVDHINGDRTDNRICNLRLATPSENLQNQRRAMTTNASGLLGVVRQGRRWRAKIELHGVKVHLGMFDSPEAAHQAYVHAKRRIHSRGTL